MKLKDVVSFELQTITADTPLRQAVSLLQSGARQALLVQEQGRAVGVFGAREARDVGDAATEDRPVAAAMSRRWVGVGVDEMLDHALDRLLGGPADYLLVTDGKERAVGLVGLPELAQALAHLCMEPSQNDQAARLRLLLDTIPDLVWLKDGDGVYLACNPRFAQFIGVTEKEIVGKTDYDLVPRELADFFREHDRRALAAGGPTVNEEWVSFASDGHRALLETIKTPMCDRAGRPVGVLGIGRDITARKQAEARVQSLNRVYAVLSGINETIVRVRDKTLLFQEACRIAVEQGGFRMAWVGQVDHASGAVHAVAHAGESGSYLEHLRISLRDDVRGHGPTARALREGRYVVSNDILTDPTMAPWREEALALGYRSTVAFPLVVAGETRGSFTLYAGEPDFFTDAEIRLLDELAKDIGFSLSFAETEQARRESESLFRGLVEQSMVGVYMIQDGRMRYANPRLAQFFGYRPEQIVDVPLDELVAADDLERVREMIGRRVAGEIEHAHYEFMARRRDGSLFPVEVFGTRVDYQGTPAVLGTLLDITQRRQHSEEMKRLHAELHALVEGTTDLIFIKDREGRYLVVNKAFALRFNRSVDQIVGHDDFDLFSQEQARTLRADDRLVIQEKLARTTEETILGPEGPVTFLTTKGPLFIEGKVHGVFGIARDITDRIEVEEQLREQKRMLDRVGMVARVGGWQFDVATMRGSWTDETARIHDLEPSARVSIAEWISFFHGVDREAIEGAIKAAVEEGKPYDLELEMTTSAGAHKWVRTMGQPVMEDGRVVRVEGAIQDITLRREAAEQLHEREELIRLLLESTAEAIYGVDLQGLCIFANPACVRILGYDNEEDLLGRDAHALFHYARADGSPYPARDCRALAALNAQEKVHVDDEVFWRRDGTSFPVEYLAHPLVRKGKTEGLVVAFNDITERKTYEAQLELQANYDALTGLANRTLLVDRMQQALVHAGRADREVAVILLDLDRFKLVNDSLGHSAGDELLQVTADRLTTCVRPGDTIARLGGDEFMIVMADMASDNDALMLAKRLLDAVSVPLTVAGREVITTASVGVALYPRDGESSESLMSNADLAMYRAKERGRNTIQFHGPEMNNLILERLEMEFRLRRALEANEFELYYQPQVDLGSGRITGAEALIRWRHPERGLLPPAEFLPLIEGSELDSRLGDWVLQQALTQMEAWRVLGLELSVSVNISGYHLQQAHFVQRLQELLAQHPALPPSALELEILETTALSDVALTSRIIEQCRHLGVAFSLDDFGTGYSSLTYLKRLPVDMLKIDQSFVRDMLVDPEDLAIIEGIIGLTQAFRRQVIAEGVETEEHGAMLLQFGCDLAQGYGIARPMPAAELPAWIASYRSPPLWGVSGNVYWLREDLPLLSAEIDHRRWIDDLVARLEYPSAGAAHGEPVMDLHECRFGQWLDGHGQSRYSHHPEFETLKGLHNDVHTLGRQLLDLARSGQNEKALARAQELYELRDRVLAQVRTLRAQVSLEQEPVKRASA